MDDASRDNELSIMTGEIISAYVANNSVTMDSMADLIAGVHGVLLRTTQRKSEPEPIELKPAVSIRASVKPDYIVCLENGKRFKSLKRHLKVVHGLTPEEYREKWGLKADYPMVAPNYAKERSELARNMGLGQKRTKNAASAKTTTAPPAKPKAPRKPRAKKPAAA